MSKKMSKKNLLKVVSLILGVILSCNMLAFAGTYSLTTMYAPDGRTITISSDEINAYKRVGWYEEPVQTLYALDGRSVVFKKSEVAAQLTVGWYEEPVILMQALDGRTMVVKKSEKEAYKNVGWFVGQPVLMYALDGRTIYVSYEDIQAYEKVNWYYGKPVKLYAPDGRVITVGENRVQEYTNVGWFTNKATADQYKPVYYNNSSIFDFSWITGVPLVKSETIIDEDNVPLYIYYYDCSFEGKIVGYNADKYLTALEDSGAVLLDATETSDSMIFFYGKGLNKVSVLVHLNGSVVVIYR